MIHVFATSNIYYYLPKYGIRGEGFPAVSITGSKCALMCDHCYARMLERMRPAETPEELVRVGRELKARGVNGLLVSGGSDEAGMVRFEGFVEALRELKRMGLKVFMHTGLVNEERALLLREAGVDMVLYDVVSSEEAIRGVLHLDRRPEDYWRGLRLLVEYGVPIAPHIVVGLLRGRPSGERRSVDVIAETGCSAAVIVVFTPYPGTPLETCSPPPPSYVVEVMEYARRRISAPLCLGCMRPRTRDYKAVERAAVDLGFEGIAFPSEDTLEYAERLGVGFKVHHECCAAVAFHARS